METPARLIKKYPNRRLYDTKTSSYITLADVKQMVLKNEDFPGAGREDQRGPVAPDPAADHPRRGIRRMPMFLLRPAVADDRSYGSAMQGFIGLLPGEEPRGFPADAEGAAGAVAEALRDNSKSSQEIWAQFMNMQGPAMQGLIAGLYGAEPEDVRAVQEQMQSQARNMFTGFQFPGFPPQGGSDKKP